MSSHRGTFLILLVSVTLLAACSAPPPGGPPPPQASNAVLEKGGQDVTGPYEVVQDWPKPMATWPGHEKWTWGATEGIFAQNPNRVFIFQRGELPALKRPVNTPVAQFGPSLSFPVNQTPFRNASQGPVASPPVEGSIKGQTKEGKDFRWEHCLFVVNANGDLVEAWTQWDSLFYRPHSVYISPYDPEKHVWVVDDGRHAVFEFTNDGKTLVKTLGTKDQPGEDDKHFNRPTFLAWLPDGTMFVADGYTNTRVVKFDKDGKYVLAWGQKGTGKRGGPFETRPGYFNSVHGIAVDPVTRRVFVDDRENRRIQVFDENGKYLDEWRTSTGPEVSEIYYLHMSPDRYLWALDSGTWKVIKYDLEGHFLYSWGSMGDWPGGLWGAHQLSVDQEGNFYIAEVSNGRAQKFRPKKNADPAKLIAKPVHPAWVN